MGPGKWIKLSEYRQHYYVPFKSDSLIGMNVTNNYSAQHLLLLYGQREKYRWINPGKIIALCL